RAARRPGWGRRRAGRTDAGRGRSPADAGAGLGAGTAPRDARGSDPVGGTRWPGRRGRHTARRRHSGGQPAAGADAPGDAGRARSLERTRDPAARQSPGSHTVRDGGPGPMILDQFRLHGRTALVTGARRGIGRAMALALAEAGADIVGVSASLEAEGSSLEREVTARGRKFQGYACDFGDRKALYAFIEQVKRDVPV